MDRPNIVNKLERLNELGIMGTSINEEDIKSIVEYINYLESNDLSTIKVGVEVDGLDEVKQLSECIDIQCGVIKTILNSNKEVQSLFIDKDSINVTFK